ncbi:MAG: Type antifreeze protein [Gammaproteobacteria bacterium]|jgi:putative FmdB family regulatory protein|nr:Type antifreeze protein [Gammaproteobacteria bacterium]
MPIYEYECKSCCHHFEVMQKISDEKLKVCPECHQESLNRLISASGFQLKGSGWYVTDFKDKPKKNVSESAVSGTSHKADDK